MIYRKPTQTPVVQGVALAIDLGDRPGRSRFFGRLQTLGIVGVLVAVASIPLSVGIATWATHRSTIAEWTAQGPDCPTVEQLSPAARGAKPPAPFVYHGAAFAYQIGDVACAAVPEKSIFSAATYPVCQFDAPAAIAVTALGRTRLFEPGVGRGAMVTIHNGRVTCTMTGGMRD